MHLEPGEPFSITGGEGEVRVEGEPTVTCEKTHGSGKCDVGSSTTGSATRDYTGCHTNVFGLTAKCRSAGSALDNTVASSGTFHLITWKNSAGTAFPAVLTTTEPIEVVCGGISPITFTGSMIATITSPKCGESRKELSLSFTATGTVQSHMSYTGINYDLKARTGSSGENKTGALVGTGTGTTSNAQKLNCT
jgi:hypothetical protein